MTSPLPGDGRLGRRFAGHDPQSRNYGVRELLPRTAVVRKPTFWPLPDGSFPLDQIREGSCEAHGFAQELAAGPVMIPGMTNEWARAYYQRIRATDRAMGNNFPDGATTLANMKTAKADNLITGYRWAFGVDDVVDTLCSVGPVCFGIDWLSGMYETVSGGRVNVGGQLVGGHFITALAYDVHPTWGPCILWLNSWGTSYGVPEPRLNARAGIGWLTLADLGSLLSRDGEAVVPADYFVAPQPLPVETLFYAARRSKIFHTACKYVHRDRLFPSFQAAVAAGLRPCRMCRPKP